MHAQDFFVYFLPILIAAVGSIARTKYHKLALTTFACIWLIAVFGLRWEIGTDWDNYFQLYRRSSLSFNSISQEYFFEYGFVVLNAIFNDLNFGYNSFLLFLGFFIFAPLMFVFYRLAGSVGAAFIVFYSSYFPAHFLGPNRRALAITLVLCALIVFTTYRRFLIIGFAATFHQSALVATLFFIKRRTPFEQFAVSRRNIIFILLVLVILSTLQPYKMVLSFSSLFSSIEGLTSLRLGEKFIFYAETYSEHTVSHFGADVQSYLSILKRILLMFPLIFVSTRTRCEMLGGRILAYWYLFGLSGYVFFVGAPIFQAIFVYFLIVECVLVGRILYGLKGNLKIAYALFLCFFGLIQMFQSLSVFPELYWNYRLPF